jgi:hypothetical protein
MAERTLSTAQPVCRVDSALRMTHAASVVSVALAVTTLTGSADAIVRDERVVTEQQVPPSGHESLRERFRGLAARWVRETTTESSDFRDFILNEAYQQIIGLGPPAVPLILEELVRAPDHWGWALQSITGENPVPPEAAGDVEAIAAAWLRWGRDRGIS